MNRFSTNRFSVKKLQNYITLIRGGWIVVNVAWSTDHDQGWCRQMAHLNLYKNIYLVILHVTW